MNPIIKWAGGKEKELPYINEKTNSNLLFVYNYCIIYWRCNKHERYKYNKN